MIDAIVVYKLTVPTASSERQLLAGYWGQNSAGPKMGPVNYEKKLKEVCQTTKYDILNVAFLYNVFDSRNKGKNNKSICKIALGKVSTIGESTPTLKMTFFFFFFFFFYFFF